MKTPQEFNDESLPTDEYCKQITEQMARPVPPPVPAPSGGPDAAMHDAARRMMPPTAVVAVTQTSPRGGSSVDVSGIVGRALPMPEPK